ncbi:MAG TPA: AMP-binding protein [Beijerinckiaceae bacterium]|nr:AMP-binding protein [Beijerinckiaceae bacterium]
MDLSDFILRHAAFAPDKPAMRFEGRMLTYAALAERIEAAARALKSELGIGRGDRVAVLAVNHPDTLVVLYACARLGAMLVPLNWRLAVQEQLFILTDASVSALVVEEAFAATIGPLREALPEAGVVGLDFAPPDAVSFEHLLARGSGEGRVPHVDLSSSLLVVYTSGTTGRPKGAVLRQEALFWNGVMSQHMHGLTADDHVLTVLPLFHVGGLNIQTTPALHHGATVTLHPRFAPEKTLAAIAQDRPTLTVLVPATMQAVIEHPSYAEADLSSLRALTTGSTTVPQPLIDAFERRGVPVLQVYGSTETCPIAIHTSLSGDRSRAGSTGLSGLVCEAKIVDDAGLELPPGTAGEIALRGPNLFCEYWGDAAATAAALRDGWYFSGDVGMRDDDGYVFVHDRRKNLIISGGENVYPAEIERVLLTHPSVAEAAVIGRPDPKWQEVPAAYVVLRAGMSADAASLKAHVAGELARFKVPRDVVFVDSLPRNVMGKVQHFRLRDGAADAPNQPVAAQQSP